MKRLIFVAALVLAGCASEGDKAADAYQQARNSGASMTQLCRSAKAVEATYRANGEASKADRWSQSASIDCNGASLIEGYRPY